MNVTLESWCEYIFEHQHLDSTSGLIPGPGKNSTPSPGQKWLPGVRCFKLILFCQIWGEEVFAQSCLARRKIMGLEDERLYWPSEDGPQSGKAVFYSIFNSPR